MDTAKLKQFAQQARTNLMSLIANKVDWVLAEGSEARRLSPQAVMALEKTVSEKGKKAVVDQVAYFWFNRLCALRFMDVNRYTKIGVVSPVDGAVLPEVLSEAISGYVDSAMVPNATIEKILGILSGSITSDNPQAQAYRLLLVAACNYWYKSMPFLFQKVNDYTELLLPDDLLSERSILAAIREAMPTEECQDVEVIGWLYQYYISEKKDEVFEALKKNVKISPENIPAATQLFTPHWIVKYLVENSLGRLWMLNHPESSLVDSMAYYIKPDQEETDFLKVNSPEELKVCDPACGSGHMLIYAFDLLYKIYEEEGYAPSTIAELILTKNLFGIEIDERAGELAAFALNMKARAKDRQFFKKQVEPQICVLKNVKLSDAEIHDYAHEIGEDLFTEPLWATLKQFEEANNFGSLIEPKATDIESIREVLKAKDPASLLFLSETHKKVLEVLKQADFLSPKYDVVVANPPYMGRKGMNGRLAPWIKEHFANAKADIYATFICRGVSLAKEFGYCAMVTMQSWMFLSTFEELRNSLINNKTILSMAHIGARGFDSISGEVVSTTAFILANAHLKKFKGAYLCLVDEIGEMAKQQAFLDKKSFPYLVSSDSFQQIPGSPIAYWVSSHAIEAFRKNRPLSPVAMPCVGLQTGDNGRFLRNWAEVSVSKIGFSMPNASQALDSKKKWFPYNKGGEKRRWYGNQEFVVNWENDGYEIKHFTDENGKLRSRPQNTEWFFNVSASWSKITSGGFSLRYYPCGFIFDVAGCSIFAQDNNLLMSVLGALNSSFMTQLYSSLMPTLNTEVGQIAGFPLANEPKCTDIVDRAIQISKEDWDSFETSWNFKESPLLSDKYQSETLSLTYESFKNSVQENAVKLKQLEEENNKLFIEAYGLHHELTSDVPLKDVTLSMNPCYRYGAHLSNEELDSLMLADTMRDFVSYAVGCMFGRYSIDKDGLILANQGDKVETYDELVPNSRFRADADNCLPILGENWFADDIVSRFRQFLMVTFGEEHFQENLQFIEKALNVKNKANYTIRDYFVNEFYADHIKRYKKRPIYWLFSSPKGSFNALIYMHRYRPDTVSVVLNDYLRKFRDKLQSNLDSLQKESVDEQLDNRTRTKALKEMEKIKKIIKEVEDYEREVLYPLAHKNIEINLDDGVKVNYLKFGAALKKIPGLASKEE